MNRICLLTCLFFLPLSCGVDQLGFEFKDPDEPSGGSVSTGGSVGGDTGNESGGNESGGTGSGAAALGGFGGMGGATEPRQVGELFVKPDTTVTAIETNETHVYWLEYGTSDDLGNYLRDGKLLRTQIDGGDVEVVAENLQGPRRLFLSGFAAFITVDESVRTDPAGVSELWSVAIDGGVAEFLQSGDAYGAGSQDHAVWQIDGVVVGSDANGPLTGSAGKFEDNFPDEGNLGLSDTHAYWIAEENVYTAPLSDLSVWSLYSEQSLATLAVSGNSLFGITLEDDPYLITTKIMEPAWTRLQPFSSSASATTDLEMSDDRFFAQINYRSGPITVTTGKLSNSEVTIFSVPWNKPWAGSTNALFYMHFTDIYRVAVE